MTQLNFGHSNNQTQTPDPRPQTPKIIPILIKAKDTYLTWYNIYQILPKLHRHSLGQRIDGLLVELIESIATAAFLLPSEKTPYVRLAMRKVDTLRILLMILWETKSLDDKKYISVSMKVEEIGKMLGGWHGQLAAQLTKQNSPTQKAGEK